MKKTEPALCKYKRERLNPNKKPYFAITKNQIESDISFAMKTAEISRQA